MQGVIVEFNTPPLAYLKYEKMIRIYIYKTEMRVVFVWGVAYGKYVWSASVGWVGNNFPRRTWRRDQGDGSTLVSTRHTFTPNSDSKLAICQVACSNGAWMPRVTWAGVNERCDELQRGPTEIGGLCWEKSTRTGIQTSTSILGSSDVGPTVQKQNITSTTLSLYTDRNGMPAKHVPYNSDIIFLFS